MTTKKKERTAHSSTQVFGLALISAAILTVMVVIVTVFDGEDAGFFAVIAAVVLATTFVVWRFDTQWARVLGLVLTIASVLMMFWLAFGLFQIFSPLEFVVGLTYVLGVLLSLVGGIRALIASRKGVEGPTRAEGRVRTGVLTVIGVAAVVSIVGFIATKESVDDAAAAGATAIDMTNFEFEPGSASVPAGGKILLQNKDPFVHDFTLDALGIAVTVGPGSEVLVDLSAAGSGAYDYFCSLHSDGTSDMIGSLTVAG